MTNEKKRAKYKVMQIGDSLSGNEILTLRTLDYISRNYKESIELLELQEMIPGKKDMSAILSLEKLCLIEIKSEKSKLDNTIVRNVYATELGGEVTRYIKNAFIITIG